MKGVRSWFIACLISFGLFVPFVSIYSDVNAMQYDIGSVPLYVPSSGPTGSGFYNTSNGLQLSFVDPPDCDDNYDNDTPNCFSASWLYNSVNLSQRVLNFTNNNDSCNATGYRHFPYYTVNQSGLSTLKWSFPGYDVSHPWGYSNQDQCLTIGQVPNLNQASILPLVPYGEFAYYNSLPPYRLDYSTFYLQDSYKDEQTGIVHDTTTDLLFNLFGREEQYPYRLVDFYIPYGNMNLDYYLNEDIVFSGEFVTTYNVPVDLTNGVPDQYFEFELETTYYDTVNNGSMSVTVPCEVTSFEVDNPDDPWSAWSTKYTCKTNIGDGLNYTFNPENGFPWFRLHVINNFARSPEFYTYYYNSIIFESVVTVTENDYTPGGTIWATNDGRTPGRALGSASANPFSNHDANYGQSLQQMFSFDFINPFAPLFGLFLDNSTCATIPTIAGMIHSEEITICPWFDSTTRDIVTPVLGISSMMLIFGFAVRWLGARSGNLFEDSMETDHYSFRSRVGGHKK